MVLVGTSFGRSPSYLPTVLWQGCFAFLRPICRLWALLWHHLLIHCGISCCTHSSSLLYRRHSHRRPEFPPDHQDAGILDGIAEDPGIAPSPSRQGCMTSDPDALPKQGRSPLRTQQRIGSLHHQERRALDSSIHPECPDHYLVLCKAACKPGLTRILQRIPSSRTAGVLLCLGTAPGQGRISRCSCNSSLARNHRSSRP
mmetsp:Transcript_92873/g.165147  ORF Transcript_92873/g.165147 Transcript_92873/m.165147 type:complete len:200 (+) Transcript_92873:1511-2110(+)